VIELRGITWDHVRGWGGLRAAADAFAAERPDVRVTWEARSLQRFADQPADELASYDLIVLDHPAIGDAVERRAILPLDDLLDAEFVADQLRNGVGLSAESYRWHGKTYALATDAAAQVAAYRPDLLERAGVEVPRTWPDVLAVVERLGRIGAAIAMPAIPVDAICAFLATCVAFGDEPFRGDRVVAPEVGRRALETLSAAIQVAHPESLRWNPPGTFEHMTTLDDVAYCPLAFGYVTYATVTPSATGSPKDPSGRRALRFTGGPAGADGRPRGTLGGAGLAISSRTRHAHEAAAFARFVASAEVQRGVYVDGGGQPGHRAAWTDDDANARTGGFFADTLEAMDAAYVRPRGPGFVAFQDAAGDAVHAWLRDGGDAGTVLSLLETADRERRRRMATVSR
jgi:multiple sugar transport system substrate-binding protein